MKKYVRLLTLVVCSLLICSSLAFAQGEKSEAEKAGTTEKEIIIKLPEGAGQGMPGCHTMGQMGQPPAGGMMGQAGPMGGCGMGMGARPGMGCGMRGGDHREAGCGAMCGSMGEGMGAALCRHGCACCYLKCADALQLTGKQIDELKAICSAAKKAEIQKQADISIAELELEDLLRADVLDFAKAKAKITEISELKASVQIERLNNVQKAQKVLTAEQAKQCRAMCGETGRCGGMTGKH